MSAEGEPIPNIDRLIESANRLSRAANGLNANSNTTTFNAGGLVGMMGVLAIGLGAGFGALMYGMAQEDRADWAIERAKYEANLAIANAKREADLRELSTLKRDVATIQAYTTLHGQKITKLETYHVETERR